jgi:hypothetical protein
MSMEGKRHVAVRLPAWFIEDLCRGTKPGRWMGLASEIPPDARCTGVVFDIRENAFWVRFEHESFPLVHPGSLAPGFPAPNVTELHGAGIVADLAAGRIGVPELADLFGVPLPRCEHRAENGGRDCGGCMTCLRTSLARRESFDAQPHIVGE